MENNQIGRSEAKRTKRGFFNRYRYGQKGFTLIELLVVVAILGVLAAVVMPNVGKFMGSGKEEAGKTELANVQLAMTAMMADQGITTVAVVLPANASANMTAFPGGGNQLSGGAYNYIQNATTTYYYSVAADGTVQGWWDTPGTLKIGVDPAP